MDRGEDKQVLKEEGRPETGMDRATRGRVPLRYAPRLNIYKMGGEQKMNPKKYRRYRFKELTERNIERHGVSFDSLVHRQIDREIKESRCQQTRSNAGLTK